MFTSNFSHHKRLQLPLFDTVCVQSSKPVSYKIDWKHSKQLGLKMKNFIFGVFVKIQKTCTFCMLARMSVWKYTNLDIIMSADWSLLPLDSLFFFFLYCWHHASVKCPCSCTSVHKDIAPEDSPHPWVNGWRWWEKQAGINTWTSCIIAKPIKFRWLVWERSMFFPKAETGALRFCSPWAPHRQWV